MNVVVKELQLPWHGDERGKLIALEALTGISHPQSLRLSVGGCSKNAAAQLQSAAENELMPISRGV